MTDLPEDLQPSYDALKYLFESTMTQADAEEALADLENLVGPYRVAQRYYAGSHGPYRFLTAWTVRHTLRGPERSGSAQGTLEAPPTLLDLVLKAQEVESGG